MAPHAASGQAERARGVDADAPSDGEEPRGVAAPTSHVVHSCESPAIAATIKLTPELIERLCSAEPPAVSISFADGGGPEDDAVLVVDGESFCLKSAPEPPEARRRPKSTHHFLSRAQHTEQARACCPGARDTPPIFRN